MNKRYPHLVGKLPAPRELISKNKLIIFEWWAREARNNLTKSNGGTKIWFEKDPWKSRKTQHSVPPKKDQ